MIQSFIGNEFTFFSHVKSQHISCAQILLIQPTDNES